ncbi:hypothetical protein LCGC14_0524130 [marine sediment metagenome]|uniref:Uncharacterized protein n=1 Tax=marine sediment metagenome TaxID=412755 RepID=A0A0F9V5Q5_9ZZZZ|nr:hypothetical protein [Methylophaga sp.]HEC58134.1 hypothetical protein [Methylophaga sp.]
MKISFLVLLLIISNASYAGERIKGISGSMGKSATPFSTLLVNSTVIDNSTNHVQSQTEQDTAVSLLAQQNENSTSGPTEINPIADINAEFDDIHKPAVTDSTSTHKKPTQLFSNTIESEQSASEKKSIQAVNHLAPPQVQEDTETCMKEKVYSLNVENAAQYERLEDFPFTYECVTPRE